MNHPQLEGLAPQTGTEDDDDDRDDEHPGENEAAIREVDDQTEAPEEFEIDDEDEIEDDDAIGDEDEIADSDGDDEGPRQVSATTVAGTSMGVRFFGPLSVKQPIWDRCSLTR